MGEELGRQEIDGSRQLLDQLFKEVKEQEGTLAGGQKLGLGGRALKGLLETKVSFGHPAASLVQLTAKLFDDIKVELNPIRRDLLENQFDFYYMILPVSLFPDRGAQFQLVECLLNFGPEGKSQPIVHKVFPQSQWRSLLEWGGRLDLALNGDLDWEAAIAAGKIAEVAGIKGVPRGKITAKNRFKGHVLVPDFTFKLSKAEIIATGEGDTWCKWRLQNPELREQATVPFVVIFQVPQGTKAIELTGKFIAEPRMRWLAAQLDPVFSELSKLFKKLFKKGDDDRRGKERLPIGDHEKWTLTLPRRKPGKKQSKKK
jgi:hypothetical protein